MYLVPPLIPIIATTLAIAYGWYLGQPKEKQEELNYRFAKWVEHNFGIRLTTEEDAVKFAKKYPNALEEFKKEQDMEKD